MPVHTPEAAIALRLNGERKLGPDARLLPHREIGELSRAVRQRYNAPE